MNGDRVAEAMFVGLALTLPLSVLIVRRVSPARVTRLAMLWAVIIVGMVLLIGLVQNTRQYQTSAHSGARAGERSASKAHDPTSTSNIALHNMYYQDA